MNVNSHTGNTAAGQPRWTDRLSDGTHVLIRPIQPADADIERAFIRHLSPQSRRMRFLGQIAEPSDTLIRDLTNIDRRRDMAFVALVHRDGAEQEIGVSRYSANGDGSVCECAVAVADDWQRRGLGTLLMRHLIDYARAQGIRELVSYDASENRQMRELAADLGFVRTADRESADQVVHRLKL
jgi:GNAT superfamily N-acetyltransferase